MKKLFFCAAALLMAISFTACTKDDDESSDGGGNTPAYYVTRVETFNSDDNTLMSTATLEYDEQNRLIAVNDCSLVYEGNKLIWIEDGNQGDTLLLNDKGFPIIDGSVRHEYDNDGYLMKILHAYDSGFDDYFDDCFIWGNGDLIEIHSNNSNNTVTYSYYYSYYDYINNQNLCIEFMSPDVDDYSFLMCCGRNTRHLVKSQRIETDGYIVYFNYKYELDSKGRPVTIYEEWKDSYGGTHNYTYKLSYK